MSSQSVGLNVCERASGHNNDRKLLLGRVQCCTLGSLLAQTFYSDLLPSYYLWQQGLCDPAENCQENGWNRQQNNKYSNNTKPFLLVLLLIVIGCSTFICYLKKISQQATLCTQLRHQLIFRTIFGLWNCDLKCQSKWTRWWTAASAAVTDYRMYCGSFKEDNDFNMLPGWHSWQKRWQ